MRCIVDAVLADYPLISIRASVRDAIFATAVTCINFIISIRASVRDAIEERTHGRTRELISIRASVRDAIHLWC